MAIFYPSYWYLFFLKKKINFYYWDSEKLGAALVYTPILFQGRRLSLLRLMASSLRRLATHSRQVYRFPPTPLSRPFSASSDSLVEIQRGEVGMVSGIPQEHLRRKVCKAISFALYASLNVTWIEYLGVIRFPFCLKIAFLVVSF